MKRIWRRAVSIGLTFGMLTAGAPAEFYGEEEILLEESFEESEFEEETDPSIVFEGNGFGEISVFDEELSFEELLLTEELIAAVEEFPGETELPEITVEEPDTEAGTETLFETVDETESEQDLVMEESMFEQLPAPADAETSGNLGENLSWTLDENGLLLITGTGRMPDYTFPYQSPFAKRDDIKTVVIEEGITNVGDYAFFECSKLSEARLPESVKSIGEKVFQKCETLCVLVMPSSIQIIGENAFKNCYDLETIRYTGTPVEWDTVTVGTGNVKLLVLTDKSHYDGGSFGEGLSWDLTDGVLTISGNGEMPAWNEYVSYAKLVGSDSPWDEYSALIRKIVIEEGITNVSDFSFACVKAEEIAPLPETVEKIGAHAFYMSRIRQLALPSSLKEIGEFAFGEMDELTDLTLPQGIAVIPRGMLRYSAPRTVIIPASVTKIEASAFEDCSVSTVVFQGTRIEWESVEIGEKNDLLSMVTVICADDEKPVRSGSCGENVLWSLNDEGMLTISGNGAMTDYSMTALSNDLISDGFNPTVSIDAPWALYTSEVTSVVVEEGVTHIGDNAFYNCYHATDLSLPATLASIGNNAFRECGFYSIIMPDAVTTIGEACFQGCERVKSMILSKNITSVPDYCMYGAFDNASLIIPEGVTRIGKDALYNANLSELTIPSTLNTTNTNYKNTTILHFSGAMPSCIDKLDVTGDNPAYCKEEYYGEYKEYWLQYARKNTPGYHLLRDLRTEGADGEISTHRVTLSQSVPSLQMSCVNAQDADISWLSCNTDYVSVSDSGMMTIVEYFKTIYVCAEISKEQQQTLSFCSVTVKDEERNDRMVATLPVLPTGGNLIATSAVSGSSEGNIGSYYPFQYVVRDTENIYYKEILALVQELTAGCTSDTQKAKAIQRWVTSHVTYSLSSLCMGEYVEQAYTVYVNRKGNCQGFSKLTGLMLYLAGITSGIVSNEVHMWNIAFLEGQWVMIDSTNDQFDFDNSDIHHPDIVNIVFTQDNMTMIIDKPGEVKLAGVGVSFNRTDREAVEEVNIPDYVSTVFGSSCKLCSALKKVTIPNSVKSICSMAFANCNALEEVLIPASVTTIASDAFSGCYHLTIWGNAGSAAETYAKEAGFPFEIYCPSHNLTAHKGVNPGCETAGTEAYWECTLCGRLFSDEAGEIRIEEPVQIPAAHTVIKDEATAATCTQTGLTEGSHCAICGKILIEQKEIPVKDHEWDTGRITKEATALSTGVRTYTCKACGDTKTQSVAKLKAVVKLNKKKVTLKKKGKKVTLRIKSMTKGDMVLKWKSSNRKVATVSKKGVVKAKKKGKCTITLYMKSGAKAECKIVVKK